MMDSFVELETPEEIAAFSAFLLSSADTATVRGLLEALSRVLPLLVPVAARSSVVLPAGEGQVRVVALEGAAAIPLDVCLPVETTNVGQAFLTGKVRIMECLSEGSPYADLVSLYARGLRSSISIPLRKGARILGVMNCGARHPHDWQRERPRLEQLARIAATQLWLHAHIQEAEESLTSSRAFADTLATVTELGRSLSVAEDEPELLSLIQSAVPDLLPCRRMSLVLIEEDSVTLYGRVLHGPPSLRPDTPFNATAQSNLSSCLLSGMVEVVEDTRESMLEDAVWAAGVGVGSIMSAPLDASGDLLGVLNFGRTDVRSFSAEDIAVARQLGATLATAIVALRKRERLDEARARAAEMAELKGRFLAVMAHELRTPLYAVIGMSELLIEEGISDHQRKMIETICASGKILNAMISNVLDFSRLDNHEMRLVEEPFEVEALTRETMTILARRAESRSVQLKLSADLPHPVLTADPSRFRQVLLNLLSNAIKFTAEGMVRVQLSPWSEGGVEVSVQDTGLGIPEAAMESIFEPFRQVDASTTRRFGGAGLGLTICRQLCEAMGGWIRVESRLGEGSTFTFTIAGRLQPRASASPAQVTACSERSVRILLVDDQPVNRLIIRTQLESLGFAPTSAACGAEARALYAGEPFDLVLIDVHMPDEDGPEITAGLLSAPGPHAVFIALTADVLPETKARCLDAGMTAVVAKPVCLEELSSLLQAISPRQGAQSAQLAGPLQGTHLPGEA